jgi:nicotinamidase-related amidase
LRAAGGLVVFTRHTADAEALRTWSVYFEHFFTPKRRARFIEAFTPGNPGHALWPELDVGEQDVVVNKRRFGALVPGSSDLHERLFSSPMPVLPQPMPNMPGHCPRWRTLFVTCGIRSPCWV